MKLRDIRINRTACRTIGQRSVDLGQQAAAIDVGVAVAGRARDRCRCAVVLRCRRPAIFGQRQRLPGGVVGDPGLTLPAGNDAWTGNQRRTGTRARGIFVAHLPLHRRWFAVLIALLADRQRSAIIIAFGKGGVDRIAGGIESGQRDLTPARVVAVAHIAGIAQRATGTTGFEQTIFAGDIGVPVGGALAEAVGQDRDAAGLIGQRDFVDITSMGRQHCLAISLIAESRDALQRCLAVANTDTSEQRRMLRIVVVVLALGLCRQTHPDQIGQQRRRRDTGTRRRGTAVVVVEASDRTVD